MKFYSIVKLTVCTAVLVACGSGDDRDEKMSATTTNTGGVGLSTGSDTAPSTTTAGPAVSTGAPSSATAATTGSLDGGSMATGTTGTTGTTGGAPTTGVGPMQAVPLSPEIAMRLEDFATQWNMHSRIKCDCYEVFGFSSTEECLESEQLIEGQVAECSKAAFALDEASARVFFDCATPATEAHTTCLQESFVCGRPYAFEAFQACASPFSFEFAGCPEVSDAIVERLSGCDLFL